MMKINWQEYEAGFDPTLSEIHPNVGCCGAIWAIDSPEFAPYHYL